MSSWSRLCTSALVTCVGLLCWSAGNVRAQDWPLLGGWAPYNWGGAQGITIAPSVRIGYEKCGFNFNLPVTYGTLDLSLKKAEQAVGSAGLLVTYADRIGVFANIEGSLPRHVSVLTEHDQVLTTPFSAINWAGSRFQRGSLEAGLMYPLYAPQGWSSLDAASSTRPNGVFLVGGVRWNRISTKIAGPEHGFHVSGSVEYDNPPIITIVIGFEAGGKGQLSGDIHVPMWIPYFGLQFTGTRYRATLVGSPFASVKLRIPLRLHQDAYDRVSTTGSVFFPLLSWVLNLDYNESAATELGYQFDRIGSFLEGNFEYDVPLARGWGLNLWARGNWLHFRGNGTAGWKLNGSQATALYGYFDPGSGPIDVNLSSSSSAGAALASSATGSVNIYTYAVGVSAVLSF